MWGGDRRKNMLKYSFYTENNQNTVHTFLLCLTEKILLNNLRIITSRIKSGLLFPK